MFRLIKLAALAFLGYALYEFFLGLTGDAERSRGGRPSAQSERSQARSRPLTGSSGQGQSVRTEDADGGGASHVVGRGVVRE